MAQYPREAKDALLSLSDAVAQERSAQVAKVLALAAAADSYRVGLAQVHEVELAMGAERRIQPGPDGTPFVGEFLALEVGPLLGISPEAALGVIGRVLDVRARFPKVWRLVVDGAVEWRLASAMAERCTELSADAAAEIDRRCALVLPGWPLSRLLWHLKKWVIEADPHLAARKEAVARVGRYVMVDGLLDGQCQLWGRLAPEDAIAFDAAINRIADELPPEPLPESIAYFDHTPEQTAKLDRDRRRAAAVGVLARQAFGQDALPTHQLVVHVDAADPALTYDGDAANSGVALVEKWGAFLTSRLPEFLAGSRVVVRPVIDPTNIGSQSQHDPTADLRLAVCTRNPVEVFPFGARKARACDLDHTEPYRDDGSPGQTNCANLGPLSRFTHRAKTHAGFHVCQPRPGIYHWVTPAGFQYLVTPRGTYRLANLPVEAVGDPPPVPPYEDPPPEHPAWDAIGEPGFALAS